MFGFKGTALTVTLAAFIAVGCNTTVPTLDALTSNEVVSLNDALSQLRSLSGLAASTHQASDEDAPNTKPADADNAGPVCPTIDISLNQSAFTINFDFGDSCTPTLYPDVTFSGTIGGTIVFSTRTLTLEMDGFSAGGETATGDATLTFSNSAESVEFNADAAFTVTNHGNADVNADWTVTKASGVVTLNTLSGSATDSGGTDYAMGCESLVFDPAGNSNFVPESGTATLTFDDQNSGPRGDVQTTILVTFNAQSPVDGTVLVSINGGTAFEYTLEGF